MAALSANQVLTLLTANGVSGHSALTSWLATAKAESGLNPTVVNSIGAVGLFQILQPVHVKVHPDWTVAYLQDPSNNVAAAKTLSANWTNHAPWVSSTLGQAFYSPSSSLDVTSFLKQGPILPANTAGPVVRSAIDATFTSPQIAAKAYGTVTNPHNWMRVAYGIVGIALIYAAILSISKGTVVNAAAGIAKKVVQK